MHYVLSKIQILIKVPPVNSEVLVQLKNIESPGYDFIKIRTHMI
jgi:hypothetical protein